MAQQIFVDVICADFGLFGLKMINSDCACVLPIGLLIVVVLFLGQNGVTTQIKTQKTYNFDAVLQPETSQQEVFDEGVKPIVDHVLSGTSTGRHDFKHFSDFLGSYFAIF